MEAWKFVVLIIGSYLIGNIFFARIISKIRKQDITKQGSGNPGTMNMLRNQGFHIGLLTLVLDMLKGAIPALVGFYLFGGGAARPDCYIGLYVGGISALVGNIFPVFYKFKGGKGAAVVYGMFCVANPLLGLFVFIGGFIYLLIFDYAALMSFSMITVFTVVEAYNVGLRGEGNIVISALLFVIFCLVWFAHRQNIFRLLVGKENKVNLRASLAKYRKKKEIKRDIKRKNSNEMG